MNIEETLEDLLPKKLVHVKLSLISFYISVVTVLTGVYIIIFFRDAFNSDFLYSIIPLYLGFSLIMVYLIKRARTSGSKHVVEFFQKWALEKYALTLDESQARTLIEPVGYRNLKKRYVSEPLEVWTEDELNRKHLQTLRLIKPPADDFIVMHMEASTELMSRVEQEEVSFFQTLWGEVRNNGGFFGLYDTTKEKMELHHIHKDAQKIELLWSDPLRAELYNSGNANNKIVHIEFPVFMQQILPQQAQNNIMLGLNWGEEQRIYPTSKIAELIQ